MNQKKPRFSVVLTESIVEGLNSISPTIHFVTIFYLSKYKAIPSNEYIDNPEAIDQGLREIFGFGAKVIEKKILEFLYTKLEVPQIVRDDFVFSEEVKRAKKLAGSVDLMAGHTHH
jgi:hypothetical protein